MGQPTIVPSTINNTVPNALPYTFSLTFLRNLLKLPLYWVNEQQQRAKRVARFRLYYEGDHDAKLSPQMEALLRIADPDDGFTLNMMTKVVDTKADRCIVQSIEGVVDDNELEVDPVTGKKPVVNEASKWAQQLMDDNDFDALQDEIHSGTMVDADSFLLASWDNDKQQVVWTHEEAYDGQSGILMAYPGPHVREPVAAIKIWQIQEIGGDPGGSADAANKATSSASSEPTNPAAGVNVVTTRVNIYYPDHIEKYQSLNGASFMRIGEDEPMWTMPDGSPIGIPIIHFRNGGRRNYGIGELRNAISPQNALNRFNYSAVMAAELTAFAIYVAMGFDPPAELVPGMVLVISKTPLSADQKAEFSKLPATDIKPILDMINAERQLIAEITNTPSPDLAAGSGSNKSGEFLKQLEVGLVGKCRRFMTRAGQSWERVMDLSWRIQAAFGQKKPPVYKRWVTRWRSPEIRNNAEQVQNAVLLNPIWGKRQTMRAIAPVYDLTEEGIAKLMIESQEDIQQAQAMQAPVDQTNPATGKVTISEPGQTIGAQPTQTSGTVVTPSGQQPTANKPAVRGKGLPSSAALQVSPITHEELAAVGAMHRKMVPK